MQKPEKDLQAPHIAHLPSENKGGMDKTVQYLQRKDAIGSIDAMFLWFLPVGGNSDSIRLFL